MLRMDTRFDAGVISSSGSNVVPFSVVFYTIFESLRKQVTPNQKRTIVESLGKPSY